MAIEVPGKRRRGRPKRRWLEHQERLVGERIVKGGRPSSMEASHKTHRPHIKVGKDAEEEEDTHFTVIYRLGSPTHYVEYIEGSVDFAVDTVENSRVCNANIHNPS